MVCLGTLFSCKNQSNPDSDTELTSRIDGIFSKWDIPTSPGAAVAVIKDGDIVFKKGYGIANLEYDIPITPKTVFNIASESKQFTAYCIALLEKEGKLSFDDDIRKHLPYVPDFGKTITIKNLIYHTSGLREDQQLLEIKGVRTDDVIKQEDIVELVKNQKALNFDPGTRHLYCNTGYSLLAEIVKAVSGKSLRAFAEQEIFKPLGMDDTFFYDRYEEIVKNQAYSYERKDSSSFKKSYRNTTIIGSGNLLTTIEDEAKWLHNLNTGQIGGMETVKQMYELGLLKSGDTLQYAFGLNLDSYKGYQRIGHGGNEGGYNSYVVRFPEANLGIIVFGNVKEIGAYDEAIQIADIFLTEKKSEKLKKEHDLGLIKSRVGEYLSNEGLRGRIIDSTDFYFHFDYATERLTPVSNTTFSFFNGSGTLKLSKSDENFLEFNLYDEKQVLRKYTPIKASVLDLKSYEGVFRSEELDTEYTIQFVNNDLILQHKRHKDVKLTAITDNQFSTPHWFMANIIFIRNNQGEITSFEINYDRVLHLLFNKVE